MDFFDELAGVAGVGTPDLQRELGLSYAAAVLVVLWIPTVAGLLLEPVCYVLADRRSRKPFVVGGLAVLGLAQIGAGLAGSAASLGVCLAVAFVASGVGVNLAQATLVDVAGEDRERALTRWELAGVLGDLAAPLLVAALAAAWGGWRGAFAVSGAAVLGYAGLLATRAFPAPGGGNDGAAPAPPWRQALRAALSNRTLLLCLLGTWLCGLLDEILVSLGALHLRDAFGADAATRGLVLAGESLGAGLGVWLAHRLLGRVAPRTLLLAGGAATAVSYAAWLAAPSLAVSALLLATVGFCSAPLYALAVAQAYRALPGQSGMVNAVGSLFSPLDAALPFALAAVVEELGLVAALAVLGVQPLGALVVVRATRPTDRAADP